jgi:hypothetical protein
MGFTDFTERALADDLDSPKVCQLDLSSSQPEVLGLCLAVLPDLSVFGVLGVQLGEPCLHFDTSGRTHARQPHARRDEGMYDALTWHYVRWPSQLQLCSTTLV